MTSGKSNAGSKAVLLFTGLYQFVLVHFFASAPPTAVVPGSMLCDCLFIHPSNSSPNGIEATLQFLNIWNNVHSEARMSEIDFVGQRSRSM